MKKKLKRSVAALLAVQMILALPAGTGIAFAAEAPVQGNVLETFDGWTSRVVADAIEVNVLAFGADPSGKTDSAAAVERALAFAKEEQEKNQGMAVRLLFAKGEYGFWSDYAPVRELYVSNTVGTNQAYKDKHIGILVEDMHDVTIDGGGSMFLYHGDITTFASIRSENVVFTNFDFDFASPTVVDVTVESREGSSVVAYIPECYNYTIDGTSIRWQGEKSPVTGAPYWSGSNGLAYTQIYDYASGRTWRASNNLFSNVSKIEDIGDNRVKITYSNTGNMPPVGYCYQMRNTTRTTPGTFFWESKDVTVKDVNVHFLHGFGMVGQLSDTITLDNVDFTPRPGSGRTTVGFADFIQMSSVKGKVTVKNCTFTNPHDDPINIHGTYLTVGAVSEDNKTFTLNYRHNETGGFPQYYVGDEVEFVTKGTMIPVEGGTARVVAVDGPNAGSLNQIKITLDKAIPGITGDNNSYAVENITYTPEVEITGNRFVETPTRGILVTTRKPVLIKDNYFDGMGMASIFISCDAQGWYESGPSRDVTITGNVFDRPQSNAILIEPTNPSNDPNYQIHQNIKITDNIFNLSGPNPINAKSVNGLTIEGNTFRRYDPDVQMSLSAGSLSLAAGGSLATDLDKSGNTYSAQMYQLRACKNVKIADNVYDAGFNLRANTADGTTADDVTITGEDTVLNAANQLPGTGPVSYVSSDPSIAEVDANGVVHAKKSGAVEIWAYTACGDRIFESNRLALTVTGAGAQDQAPDAIVVRGEQNVLASGGSASFVAEVMPADAAQEVVWSVRDAATGETASFASIGDDGVLHTTSYGVAEVTATSAVSGAVYGTKLVTVSKPSGTGLNGRWSIQQSDDARWSLNAEEKSVSITGQGGGMWAGGTGARNVFVTDAPEGDFTATVKLAGKTSGNGSDWEEAGLVIMKDQNNYVAAVRKNNAGSPKLAVNNEINASPKESLMNDAAETDIFLRIVKTGTDFACSYSADGETWTPITQTGDTSSNSALTGSGLKIGFYAGNKDNGRTYTFSDFALDGKEIPLVDNNTAPSAAEAAIAGVPAAGEILRADYVFSDPENDAEGATLYRWSAADSAEGPFQPIANATGKDYTVQSADASRYLRVEVVPVDAYGSAGAPVASAAVKIADREAQPDNALLESVSLPSGLVLDQSFQAGRETYEMTAPASLSSAPLGFTAEPGAALKLCLNGTEIASGTGTLAGEIVFAEDENILTVEVTSPNGQNKKVYTFTVVRKGGSDARLAVFEADGVDFPAFSADQKAYLTTAETEQRSMNLHLKTAEETARISVRVNNRLIAGYEDNEFTQDIALAAGGNVVEITVRAQDGSTKLYRAVVFRTGSSNADAASISAVENFDPSVTDYVVTVEADENGVLPLRVTPADENARVSITANGVFIDSGSADVQLEDGLNTIIVKVTPETLEKPKYYTLTVRKQSDSDAGLAALSLDGAKMSEAFDTNTVSYAAKADSGKMVLHASTFEPQSKITVLSGTEVYEAVGSIEQEITLYEGENPVYVRVVSPNGQSVKTYEILVSASGVVYLSDLDWKSATCGYTGNIQKDKSFDGNAIRLLGEDGVVSYDKGFGIHANSVIVYDVADKGYTGFHTFVGIDQEITKPNEPNINFTVLVNDEVKFELKNANGYTKQAEINLPLDETAQTITLKAEYVAHDWSAHCSWGDTKFLTPMEEAPAAERQVQSVKPVEAKKVGLHTALADAKLPDTVDVVLDDGSEAALSVIWVGGYDAASEGAYTLKGILQATEQVSNPEGLTAECTVAVQSDIAVERTLNVTFPSKHAQLSIEGEDVKLANLIGRYEATVMADDAVTLTFTPTAEGREFAGVTVNGEPAALKDMESYTYTGKMPNADTALDFAFTVVNKQVLRTVIEIAEGLKDGDEYNAAVPSVQKLFDAALDKAVAVEAQADASQKDIDNAWAKMLNVIQYLSFAKGDKTVLKEALDTAAALEQDDYTAESWAAYELVLAAAQEVYDDADAMDKEIREAASDLNAAMVSLVYKADWDMLNTVLAQAEEIEKVLEEKYLPVGQKAFRNALNAARELDAGASQKEIDAAADALTKAMLVLQRIPNKDALKDLLGETENLRLDKYTASSANRFRSMRNAALAVADDPDATEQDVEAAYKNLLAAKAALEAKQPVVVKKSGGSAPVAYNTYGADGRVLVQLGAPSVRCDTTETLTLRRGESALMRITVSNGTGFAPNFTVGNGSVLKTQAVSQMGNVYTYRVWAVGTPGASTGVYTQISNGEPQKHCTVTIA
ncbi:cadherin-like beta sandwich domain-containing protein [Clostridium sp. D33t1_170424_F3]|uniref:cadherin-like beta sandwich domain-containing protein n=1 Tax=Clostridium sp. D33t1_170424_F3 TaxID=2787099 RepID=UPI0018AB80A9|nr:cadherin-like beta sandwich domain-containing protein [Clostridium sp. D33t1_170424_F3]